MTLRHIALIYKDDELLDKRRLAAYREFIKCNALTGREFSSYAELMDSDFAPDCVLVMNAQEPKLGPYPTYALIDFSLSLLFSRKRFVRNIFTCDAYLATSPFAKEVIGDLCFSARKIGASVANVGFLPTGNYAALVDFSQAKLGYTLLTDEPMHFMQPVLEHCQKNNLLQIGRHENGYYPKWSSATGNPLPYDEAAISAFYAKAGIGLDAHGCNDMHRDMSFRLCGIIASGAIAITNRTAYLEALFGDNILYLEPEDNAVQCLQKIAGHIAWVRANPEAAKQKADAARRIYLERYNPAVMLENLNKLHAQTLFKQGYISPENEDVPALPRVSYIMRTGGNPRFIFETLDSLKAQSYPHIEVILVLYKPLEPLQKIIDTYSPRLTFKVVEDFGGLRSTGIVTGMKNVATDYFGMMDDDDKLHPNHVRSLINTLHYHNNRDWRGEIKLAYCGSYYDSDTPAFSETKEWQDEYMDPLPDKRVFENFQFYDVERMAQHGWFMMSNAWLAHKSLVDEELLSDSFTHTHEDIHFELQFALRTHFAFSVEMTSVHRMHGANSTIVDVAHNELDIFRHMMRLSYRAFPRARTYRTYFHALPEGITTMVVPAGTTPQYLRT